MRLRPSVSSVPSVVQLSRRLPRDAHRAYTEFMLLQSWDVVVQGRPHRVELERNDDTGKTVVRIDGRAALRPFADERGEFRLEVDGRPFLLRVAPGASTLEDKGSRYQDASVPRAGANLGRVTICRGLESVTVITDPALLSIERIAPGLKIALAASTGAGLLGAVAASAGLAAAEAMARKFGGTSIDRAIRSFDELQTVGVCRMEHLPAELYQLLAAEADAEARVTIVPRRCVRAIDTGWPVRLLVQTTGGEKPVKLEVGNQLQIAAEHLWFAKYPLSPDLQAKISEEMRSATTPDEAAAPATRAPATAAATAEVVRASDLPEVRMAAPFVTTIGRAAETFAELEADAAAYRAVYPKAAWRRPLADEPLRQLERSPFDIVHLHGRYDAKTRLTDGPGWTISLKDLIVKLRERRVKMLWLASGNDVDAAREVLEWVRDLNFFLVLTSERGADFPEVLEDALRRHVAGEPLTAILADLESRSPTRVRFAGKGQALFLPR